MNQTLERVQMLLEPDQRRALAQIASQQGKSVAEVTRKVISLGLMALESDDDFVRREAALKRADALRQIMRTRRGQPLDVDVVGDMRQMREERDDQIAGRRN